MSKELRIISTSSLFTKTSDLKPVEKHWSLLLQSLSERRVGINSTTDKSVLSINNMMTQITNWLCGGIDLMWTFSLKLVLRSSLTTLVFFWKLARVQTLFCECFILGSHFLGQETYRTLSFNPLVLLCTYNSDLKWDPRSELKYTWSGFISQTNHGGVLQCSVCIHLTMKDCVYPSPNDKFEVSLVW